MKKHYFTQLLLAAVLVLSACGSDNSNNANDATSENGETEVKKLLTPMNASEFEPIPAELLLTTWQAWAGKKVKVVGYLDLFFEEGSLYSKSFKLTEKAGDVKKLIYVNLKAEDKTEYKRNTPVMVEGTIKGYWGFDGDYTVELVDAKIVDKDAKVPAKGPVDPSELKEAVSAKSLFDNYIGWLDKEITVIGNANGVTTSTTSYGVTVRVDLTDPNSIFTKYVGVNVRDESHSKSAKAKANVERKYRGKFVGDCFGAVCIDEAVEVK